MSLYRELFMISGVRGQLMVRQAACRRRLSPEARLNEWKLFRANGAKEQGERKECEERVKVSRVLNAVLDSPSGPPRLLLPPPTSSPLPRPAVVPPSSPAPPGLFHIIFMLKDSERKIFVPKARNTTQQLLLHPKKHPDPAEPPSSPLPAVSSSSARSLDLQNLSRTSAEPQDNSAVSPCLCVYRL